MVPSWMRRTKGLNSAKKISTRFSSGEPTPSPSSLRERVPRLLRCGSIPSGGCSAAAARSLCHALPGSTRDVCFMLHVARLVINSRSMGPPMHEALVVFWVLFSVPGLGVTLTLSRPRFPPRQARPLPVFRPRPLCFLSLCSVTLSPLSCDPDP